MSKRASHKQALRQLLDRHGIASNLRQDRGQLHDREHLIDEILRVHDRFTGTDCEDET